MQFFKMASGKKMLQSQRQIEFLCLFVFSVQTRVPTWTITSKTETKSGEEVVMFK